MKKGYHIYFFAFLFLLLAVILGRTASRESTGENRTASETVSSGAGEIGSVLADILWLKLDDYHHIWMYQGQDWVTATDYLPHLWLITRLDPGFEEAYVDGGYHLAINLGHVEEGLQLLEEGHRRCPGSVKIIWEKLIVLWYTRYLGFRGADETAWDYLRLLKQLHGDQLEPWNEANAAMILGFNFQSDSTRRNHLRIAQRYDDRSEAVRYARRNGLWLP